MKAISVLGATTFISITTIGGSSSSTSSFQYDYCSKGHSLRVYEDTANFFNEVFRGYSVPLDPFTCPFHPENLAYIRESKSLSIWRKGKIS